jgi:hypothetical protein
LRTALHLALAFAAVSFAGASEEGPASIDAAKRELDAIKAARTPDGVPQKNALPEFSAPELHLPGTTPSPLSKRERLTKEQLEAQRRSKHWLLDAMEKEKKLDAAAREGRKERVELESERTLAARDELRSDELELADDGAETLTREVAAYMAGWMTSQDLTLLQPGLTGGNSTNGGPALETGSGPVSAPGISSTANVARGPDAAVSLFGEKTAGPSAATPENPYLQSLLPPAQFEAVIAPPPRVSQPASSEMPVFSPAVRPREEVEPARTKAPEFGKPSENDKYFKQLKRF